MRDADFLEVISTVIGDLRQLVRLNGWEDLESVIDRLNVLLGHYRKQGYDAKAAAVSAGLDKRVDIISALELDCHIFSLYFRIMCNKRRHDVLADVSSLEHLYGLLRVACIELGVVRNHFIQFCVGRLTTLGDALEISQDRRRGESAYLTQLLESLDLRFDRSKHIHPVVDIPGRLSGDLMDKCSDLIVEMGRRVLLYSQDTLITDHRLQFRILHALAIAKGFTHEDVISAVQCSLCNLIVLRQIKELYADECISKIEGIKTFGQVIGKKREGSKTFEQVIGKVYVLWNNFCADVGDQSECDSVGDEDIARLLNEYEAQPDEPGK